MFLLDPVTKTWRHLHLIQDDASKAVENKIDVSEQLQMIAMTKGFVISDNQGSGNCMFYALSEQLLHVQGIKISHHELRQALVQYLGQNPRLVGNVIHTTYNSNCRTHNFLIYF